MRCPARSACTFASSQMASKFLITDLGDCRLVLGSVFHYGRLIADRSVDVVIDDPPYSEHVHDKATSHGGPTEVAVNRDLGFAHLTRRDMRRLAKLYQRIAKRWVLVFTDNESSEDWRRELEGAGLQYVRTLRWVKLGAAPQLTGDRPAEHTEAIVLCHATNPDRSPMRKHWNGGGKGNVYTASIVRGDERLLHTTQKPEKLLRELVADFSDPGELVFDGHFGSGTTAVAAYVEGRRFLGTENNEISPKCYAEACARLAGVQSQLGLFQRQAPSTSKPHQGKLL